MTAAGWYPDLYNAGVQRYWDGTQWTDNYAPLPQQQPMVAQPAQPASSGIGRQKLSRASGNTGACPRCGSGQFTAKRSKKGKVMGGMLAPKTQIKCVGCGQMYKRG